MSHIITPALAAQLARGRALNIGTPAAPILRSRPVETEVKETRQVRRARERRTEAVLSSPTVGKRLISGNDYHRFRKLAAQIQNVQHFDQLLGTIQNDEQRADFRRQVRPFLRFEIPDPVESGEELPA